MKLIHEGHEEHEARDKSKEYRVKSEVENQKAKSGLEFNAEALRSHGYELMALS